MTAHAQARAPLDLDWQALSDPDATLGVYMGRCAAATVTQQPLAAGRDADTPVLVVVNASLPDERIIRGRLASLAFLVEAVIASDPAILIVGEAVGTAPIAAPVRLR